MKKISLKENAFLGFAFALLLGTVVTLSSCTASEEESTPVDKTLVPVTIKVSDFSMSMESIGPATRTVEDAADYAGVKVMTLAFYASDGTEVLKQTQQRADATTYTTFGHFSCNLPIGSYTMVVIGRGQSTGDEFTLTSPTSAAYTSEKVRETFSATQAVTVTSTTPLNLNVTLSRVVAELKVVSTDGRSADITQIRTTYSAGGKTFSPTTGLATSNTGFSVTNNPSTAVGVAISVYSFLFLESDEQNIDITLEALDNNETVLFTKVITGVPMQRNKKTTLTGAIFTASPSAATFTLSTDWLTETTVTF